jgi:protein SCO1/2
MNVSFPLVARACTSLVLAGLLFLALAGCGGDASESDRRPENTLSLDVDERLADTTYALVNQDSAAVSFPDAFLGKPMVLGTIYTQCPNVCPRITANMKSIRGTLDTSEVHVVTVTFDPHRDTPDRLSAYRTQYGLENTSWPFLTGDRPTIRRLMDRLGVRHTIKGTDREFPRPDTDSSYIYTHSNQITLIDAEGRVRATYGGSQTPPKLIAEDLDKIQS